MRIANEMGMKWECELLLVSLGINAIFKGGLTPNVDLKGFFNKSNTILVNIDQTET